MSPRPGDDELDEDDYPETYLEDEDYEDFLAREFDAEGGLKGEPRVARFIWLLVLLILAAALVLFL